MLISTLIHVYRFMLCLSIYKTHHCIRSYHIVSHCIALYLYTTRSTWSFIRCDCVDAPSSSRRKVARLPLKSSFEWKTLDFVINISLPAIRMSFSNVISKFLFIKLTCTQCVRNECVRMSNYTNTRTSTCVCTATVSHTTHTKCTHGHLPWSFSFARLLFDFHFSRLLICF